jgi:hypothetical protein
MKYGTFTSSREAEQYVEGMELAGNYCTTPGEVSTVRDGQILSVWLVIVLERDDEEYLPWGLFNWQPEGGGDYGKS